MVNIETKATNNTHAGHLAEHIRLPLECPLKLWRISWFRLGLLRFI